MVSVEEADGAPTWADKRRGQILNAAATCFNREGFHGASMASIAAEAAISVGQIYRYFENKEAVITALVEQSMEEWAQRMAEVRARCPSAVEHLVEIARCHADKVGESDRAALSLEFLAEAARNPQIAQIVRNVDAAVRAQLKDALLRDGPRDDAALALQTNAIAMLIDGWAVRAVKDPTIDKEEFLRSLRVVFEALLPNDAP